MPIVNPPEQAYPFSRAAPTAQERSRLVPPCYYESRSERPYCTVIEVRFRVRQKQSADRTPALRPNAPVPLRGHPNTLGPARTEAVVPASVAHLMDSRPKITHHACRHHSRHGQRPSPSLGRRSRSNDRTGCVGSRRSMPDESGRTHARPISCPSHLHPLADPTQMLSGPRAENRPPRSAPARQPRISGNDEAAGRIVPLVADGVPAKPRAGFDHDPAYRGHGRSVVSMRCRPDPALFPLAVDGRAG